MSTHPSCFSMSVTTMPGPEVESSSTGIIVGVVLLACCLLVVAAVLGNSPALLQKIYPKNFVHGAKKYKIQGPQSDFLWSSKKAKMLLFTIKHVAMQANLKLLCTHRRAPPHLLYKWRGLQFGPWTPY
jgi:hypothetical protein